MRSPAMGKLSLAEKGLERALGFAEKPVQRRALSLSFNTTDGTTMKATSVHLDSMGGAAHRLTQVDYLLSTLATQSSIDQEVIGGDCNTNSLVGRRDEVRRLRALFTEHQFTEATEELTWTMDAFRSDFGGTRPLLTSAIKASGIRMRQKWDYIWTKGMDVTSVQTWDVPGSDHNPVIVTAKDHGKKS